MLEPVDEFLDKEDFAEEAIYTASGEDPVTILVLFDPVPAEFEVGQTMFVNAEITARCKSTDVANATNDATMKIKDVTYKVTEIGPDINGMTDIGLSKD